MLLFSGSANRPLAQKVAALLHLPLGALSVASFQDGETAIEIHEKVRGQQVFIIQPTCRPVNDNIIELCLIADALFRAGAKQLVAVIPYFGYARQDHPAPNSIMPIAAKLVTDLLATAKIDAVISAELHSEQLQGFFKIPIVNLSCNTLFLNNLQQLQLNNPIVVAPDLGGVTRARSFARAYNNTDLAIIEKYRTDQEIQTLTVIGEVAGRDCIIIDDMIASGNTICAAANTLKQYGANNIYAFVTHAAISKDTLEKINTSACQQLIVTDSIAVNTRHSFNKLQQISMASLLAAAIKDFCH